MSDNPESSFVVNRRKVDINVVREVASNHTNDKKKKIIIIIISADIFK